MADPLVSSSQESKLSALNKKIIEIKKKIQLSGEPTKYIYPSTLLHKHPRTLPFFSFVLCKHSGTYEYIYVTLCQRVCWDCYREYHSRSKDPEEDHETSRRAKYNRSVLSSLQTWASSTFASGWSFNTRALNLHQSTGLSCSRWRNSLRYWTWIYGGKW